MEFVVKKTIDLSLSEINEILDLFNTIFSQNRSVKVFMNQFVNNDLGYSYHMLMIDKDKIVGIDTYVPSYYYVNNTKYLFANGVDAAISKKYRDFYTFHDMCMIFRKYLAEENVSFLYGFPNDNMLPILIKSKLDILIGKMYTYTLPYRVGGVKKGFGVLNPLSLLFCHCWLEISLLFANKRVVAFPIHKEVESYNAVRYQRMDGNYERVEISGLEFFYKVKVHEGVRTAFLIDVTQKSAHNFCRAVRYIIRHEHKQFDLLLYMGFLPFRITGMIRIPRKYEPKNFNFVGIALDKKIFANDLIYNIHNWDVNLSNYDLI